MSDLGGFVIDPGLLAEAIATVMGPRQDSYGTPEANLGRIAALWGAYLGRDVSAQDVALMMALVKVSRLRNGYQRDSYVDLIGYAALAESLHK
jgi:hypothetical protein